MNKSKFLIAIPITVLMLLVALVGSVGAEGQNGTTLSANVDVYPHWTITYGWTITKSVTPAIWNLFTGDSGTSQYIVTVTKDGGTETAWVDGLICVTNGGEVTTENLAITAILQDGYGPPNDFLTSVSVDLSSNPVLDPGETGCYNYHVNIPIIGGEYPQPHAGGTYKVTADVTITNHSGHLGELFGPNPSATTTFINSPTLVNDTINVDDTYKGNLGSFSNSGSTSYERTFTCGNSEIFDNTATIVETGQSDDASVTVKCYDLTVTKDATTSFNRYWDWTVGKSADQSALTLSIGQQFLVNYTIVVGASSTDADFAVSGNIWVSNPAPMDASLTAVADLISPSIAATVNCPSLTVPAGGSLQCTYSSDLPDGSDRTNTATATLQNYDYDYEMTATADGTTDFSGNADVKFSSTPNDEIDECADISDNLVGDFGTLCNGGATIKYSLYVGPYDVCGDYTVDNTATFTTNDTGTEGSDSWTVDVNVPCYGGCSLTPGYWKTHSDYGPAPYDDTWALLLPDGPDTPFFLSGQTYYEVLWTTPQGGNAYYILAHAYIAAELNFLNGADPTAAQEAFDAATALFEQYTPEEVAAAKGKTGNELRSQFIALATILDDYNNGYIGPGHCSE